MHNFTGFTGLIFVITFFAYGTMYMYITAHVPP